MMLNTDILHDRARAFMSSQRDFHVTLQNALPFLSSFLQIWGTNPSQTDRFLYYTSNDQESRIYAAVLWKGLIMLTVGPDERLLDAADMHASHYFASLRDFELPRYNLSCSEKRLILHDKIKDRTIHFPLCELEQHINVFFFLAGVESLPSGDDGSQARTDAGFKIVQMLYHLMKGLKKAGAEGSDLLQWIIRLSFCFFAENTGLLHKHAFYDYLLNTEPRLMNLRLGEFFSTLNTPLDKRGSALPSELMSLPYVGGTLFHEKGSPVDWSPDLRERVLMCSFLDWGILDPVSFGPLLQAALKPGYRYHQSRFFISEEKIQYVLRPLFIDPLARKLKDSAFDRYALLRFLGELSSLRFYDPVCRSGTMLAVAYRELRRLEMEALALLNDPAVSAQVALSQFYGTDLQEESVQIAQMVMEMTRHLCDCEAIEKRISVQQGRRERADIQALNSLSCSWEEATAPRAVDYIFADLPNTPARALQARHKAELGQLLYGIRACGNLDYATGWYIKAAAYMRGTRIRCAFVAPEGLSHGEQAAFLWQLLNEHHQIESNFAYPPIEWQDPESTPPSEQRIITGLSCITGTGQQIKQLYRVRENRPLPDPVSVENINAYLVASSPVYLTARNKPLCCVPPLQTGALILDSGRYLFTAAERDALLEEEPQAADWLHPYLGADELLSCQPRYCLYLKNCPPDQLKKMPLLAQRVEQVREKRRLSKRKTTRALAETPTHFQIEPLLKTSYVAFPRIQEKELRLIPGAYCSPQTIPGDNLLILPEATLYHLGVISSSIHMLWLRSVGSRLNDELRYSRRWVYNNFPWPDATADQMQMVAVLTDKILQIRRMYPDLSLRELYGADSMPEPLLLAHRALDEILDELYGAPADDDGRISLLFNRYYEMQKQQDVLLSDETV